MITNLIGRLETLLSCSSSRIVNCAWVAAVGLSLMVSMSGCQTTTPEAALGQFSEVNVNKAPDTNAPGGEVFVLHEGDSVRVNFPGAANLNTVQVVRRD